MDFENSFALQLTILNTAEFSALLKMLIISLSAILSANKWNILI